ncbi:MAG: hypothetical protein AB7Y46_13385 [Armatimonadota bacterium]
MSRIALRPGLAATIACCLAAASSVRAQPYAAQIESGERSFTISGPRLSVTVQDGMIVQVRSAISGEVHADAQTADYLMPRGLGHVSGDPQAVERIHGPWGTQTMGQEIALGSRFPTVHRPYERSTYEAERTARGIRATWTGLSNGERDFPAESLSVEFWVEPDTGSLAWRAWGSSDTGGVYGVQVPIANLHPDHLLYLDSFSGLRYDAQMPPALVTLGGAPFLEAPVIAMEGREDTLGLWVEDEQFHPYFCYLNWSGTSFGVALEHLNLMPFEELTDVASVTWRLDAFPGGWVDAMTPYKRWYASVFADEMRVRDAVAWADRIRVVLDVFSKDIATYDQLAATFDPETVLLHEWNARAPEFDQEHPDMTPRAGYVERVAAQEAYGFHTMAYVNTYCVNYRSPVFVRDGIQDFGLPRLIRGIWRYAQPRVTWDSVQEGQLVYLDPLAPAWRRYHTDMMIEWNRVTGTDANYEDTAGACGDYGNGVIDGIFAARGTVEQFRELLRRNPQVPMAAEYGPDAIAFAVRWPLRYQQAWGVPATRVSWMSRMRPVGAYLFGHRPWVPSIRAEDNFSHHVVMACSDALGGMAQYPAQAATLRATRGALAQMRHRALLFSSRQLTADFTPERWERDLACMYRDDAGRLYRYYADENTHRMVGPDGRALYERVTGLNQFETALKLPGWPAAGAGRLLGLNPRVRYALVPGVPDRTPVQITALPADVVVTRFYGTERFTVLALEPVPETGPGSGAVEVVANVRVADVVLGDADVPPPAWGEGAAASDVTTYECAFPAHLLFVHGRVDTPAIAEPFAGGIEDVRYILMETGLDRGGEYDRDLTAAWEVPDEPAPVLFRYLATGGDAEVTMDLLVRVPAAETAVEVFVRNTQERYGDGATVRLYLNGRLVHELDLAPRGEGEARTWDTSFHRWRVPVGARAGQPLLVSIATDNNGGNNADSSWGSAPRVIADPDQQPEFVSLTDAGAVPEQ